MVNSASNNVTVLEGTSVVSTVTVGYNPISATYDPANGDVGVGESGMGSVGIQNGTLLVGTVRVGSLPVWATYDHANGFVYVINQQSNSVSVINGTRVVDNVAVGMYPSSAAYDSTDGYVYVSNEGSASVRVLWVLPIPEFVVSFATLPSTCGSIALDGATHSNGGSADLPAGTYSVSATACLYYELQSLVAAGSVTILGSSANVSGAGTVTATFAHASYTANFTTSPTACGLITFNGSVYPDGAPMEVLGGIFAASATACAGFSLQDLYGTGSVTVNAGRANVSGPGGSVTTFTQTRYPVSFVTDPADCGSITFNGTHHANGTSVQVLEGSYAVSANACAGYALQSLFGTGSVGVDSALANVSGPGAIVANIVLSAYAVSFTTTPETCGSIRFNGTTFTNGQIAAVAAVVVVALIHGCRRCSGLASLPPRSEDQPDSHGTPGR